MSLSGLPGVSTRGHKHCIFRAGFTRKSCIYVDGAENVCDQMGLNPKRNVFPWFLPTSEYLHTSAHLPKVGQRRGSREQSDKVEVGLWMTLAWQGIVMGEARLSCLTNFGFMTCMSKISFFIIINNSKF